MARKRSTAKGFDKSILKMSPEQLQARITRTGAGVHRTSKHDVNRGEDNRRHINESRYA